MTTKTKKPRLTDDMKECLRRLLLAQHQVVTARMQGQAPENAYLRDAMAAELATVAKCREWLG